jgi:hypothetical protein
MFLRALYTFSQREKVAAERPDEGLNPTQDGNPSPGSFGATLSLWERVVRASVI